MKKVITGFIIINTILFFFTAVGYAVQNEDFLDYLGRKIYNTCRGRDLTIREGEFKFENGTSVTGIQWEYELEDVITVLRELSRFEPYGVYFEGDGDGRYRYVFIQGTGIITCGEHILDIKHRD
ncbi:MAG: hypothetical protein KKH94_01270, partial [Candidatus Omnitrophica bacterium]|nr:hypothetical protein [Candidatus Omnitrophota bacterium]